MTDTETQVRAAAVRRGDFVRLSGGLNCWLEVVSADDPALLTLALPGGHELKAGRLTVAGIMRAGERRAHG